MPGFDGTGPQGQGPMTGGGFGRCTGGTGLGRGMGRGMATGQGFGMGMGMRRGQCGRGAGFGGRFAGRGAMGWNAAPVQPLSPEQQRDAMKQRLQWLEQESQALRSQLAETPDGE
ncbi:MAG: DUF5320 domain-containing protein [Desulfovibrio sp.]|nr:DUF5320 domain-containing protein [Desulfovibrio sp.]